MEISYFQDNPKESMKAYRKELWFDIPSRRGFVNITSQVEAALGESGIKEGLVLVNASDMNSGLWILRRTD